MPDKVQDQIQKVIQEAVKASCTIYVRARDRKKSWSGSGFHIGNGYIVTASHVAPPESMSGTDIDVSFDGQVLIPCQIYKTDPNIDAAILKMQTDWTSIPSVMLANSDASELGEVVAVIGAPEGWHDTITVGRISNMHQSLGEAAPSPAWNDVTFVDAKILQGVSGGMCIDTSGMVIGSVIGVTGTLASYGIGENVLCPSNKIINLIKS